MSPKPWRAAFAATAGLSALVVALPSAAHEGDHSEFADLSALRHLLSEPTHLAILVAAAAIAAWPVARLVAKRVRK